MYFFLPNGNAKLGKLNPFGGPEAAPDRVPAAGGFGFLPRFGLG